VSNTKLTDSICYIRVPFILKNYMLILGTNKLLDNDDDDDD